MKFWVGVTDNKWFRNLRDKGLDEVNFWQPSAKPMFVNIEPGTPFFFKLKRPLNHIGGYGTFVSFVRLPLALAWETFGEKNGAATLAEFASLIRPLSPNPGDVNPEIGCTLIAHPVFFNEATFAAPPVDWASNIVRGKSYEDDTREGARLVQMVHAGAVDGRYGSVADGWHAGERPAEYSTPYLAQARLGQGCLSRCLPSTRHGIPF